MLKHLSKVKKNRQRGAVKAACTRRGNKREQQSQEQNKGKQSTQQSEDLCGKCGINFYSCISPSAWIGCDKLVL